MGATDDRNQLRTPMTTSGGRSATAPVVAAPRFWFEEVP
jgi:hypothetical protein